MSLPRRAVRAPLSVVADEYTLEKCLGQSDRSDVWAALRASDGRPVVLKAYAADRGKPLADTWAEAERALLRAAATPGVPALLELVAQDPPVLVLERAPGVPLSEWLDANAPPEIGRFLEIALQLTAALAGIHAAHVIHRDVSPENIVIEPQTLRVHLVDFSFAQRLGAAAARRPGSRQAEFVGTPRYVAPEQTGWLNRGCDFRSGPLRARRHALSRPGRHAPLRGTRGGRADPRTHRARPARSLRASTRPSRAGGARGAEAPAQGARRALPERALSPSICSRCTSRSRPGDTSMRASRWLPPSCRAHPDSHARPTGATRSARGSSSSSRTPPRASGRRW